MIENNSGGTGRARGRGGGIIGDSRIEDTRLVSDKSRCVLNFLELCLLLFKD